MSNFLRMLPATAFGAVLLLNSCGPSAHRPAAGMTQASNPEADLLLQKAQAYEANGSVKKAINTYEDLTKEYPYTDTASQAQFRHAALLEQQGKKRAAFDSYQKFIENYQRSPLYSQALEHQAAVAHAAADGAIKTNFLGIKSRLGGTEIAEMLTKVRENAPHAASAPRAQHAIGQVWENRNRNDRAIEAYQVILDDYPNSSFAPESQYRIGAIYLAQATGGNQNPATLNQSRHAFEDLIQAYPGSKQAAAARKHLGEISSLDVSRSLNIADFYYDKKEYASAAFYYKEVVRRVKSGPLHDKAVRRLAELQGA